MKVCLLYEKLWGGFSRNISEIDQTCQKHLIFHPFGYVKVQIIEQVYLEHHANIEEVLWYR